MLQAGGECEGRRVDGGRGRVLQEEAPAAQRGKQVSPDIWKFREKERHGD